LYESGRKAADITMMLSFVFAQQLPTNNDNDYDHDQLHENTILVAGSIVVVIEQQQ
jgi:hypothetical protein